MLKKTLPFFALRLTLEGAGGASAPVNCPNNNFRQSADGSACVCKPGYYPVSQTTCARCLKGHRCPDGALEQCPIHYYQPEEGQVECRRCVESASDSGYYSQCLVRGELLRFCDPAVPGTQDRALETQCIPCNQCLRPYASTEGDTSQSRCYRDR